MKRMFRYKNQYLTWWHSSRFALPLMVDAEPRLFADSIFSENRFSMQNRICKPEIDQKITSFAQIDQKTTKNTKSTATRVGQCHFPEDIKKPRKTGLKSAARIKN